MLRMLAATFVLSFLVAACGDGESNPAPSPSPTPNSVTVSVTPNPVRIGQTAQATGTAQLSNGQTQAVTTGWLSDVPTVARVTDGGAVTGVSNGRANIYVVSGGRQGLLAVRVVPDFQGRWAGGLLITECSDSGFFAELAFCDALPVGLVDGFELAVSQNGDAINARPSYGPELQFPSVDATIRDDGVASFVTTFRDDLLSLEASWSINAPSSGTLVGTVDELWRVSGFAGEARLRQNIVMAERSSTTLTVVPSRPSGSKKSQILTVQSMP
jgi:hypothetical protein